DTTVDCLRELMRWGFLESVSLADSAEAFERVRGVRVRATERGRSAATLRAAERREQVGQWLLRSYALFREFNTAIAKHDVVIPELTDAAVRTALPVLGAAASDQDGWLRLAKAAVHIVSVKEPVAGGRAVRLGPQPNISQLTEQIGVSLRKRFA